MKPDLEILLLLLLWDLWSFFIKEVWYVNM